MYHFLKYYRSNLLKSLCKIHKHIYTYVSSIKPFEKLDLVCLNVSIDLRSRVTYSEKHNALQAMVIYNNATIMAPTRTSTLFRLCSHFLFL